MSYIWEFILYVFRSIFTSNQNERREYRDDFKTAYESLHSLTELLQKQIDTQEDKILQQEHRLEKLEALKFIARKFKMQLEKCEEKVKRLEESQKQ